MRFSFVVPAHNEEEFIGPCLDSIRRAEKTLAASVEIVVVLNRCVDKTGEIAENYDAITVVENARNIPRIRNAGLHASHGEIVCTLDADSRIRPGVLERVESALESGVIIGGGVNIEYDRASVGIWSTVAFLNLATGLTGLSAGMFWARREDWIEVGGYDESLPFGEDIDFARRLKQLGKKRGQKYIKLPGRSMITSSRKFDRFGDWAFFRMMLFEAVDMRRGLRGEESKFANKFFFDFNSKQKDEIDETGN